MITVAFLSLLAATSVNAVWSTDADTLTAAFQNLPNTPFYYNGTGVCGWSDSKGNFVICKPTPDCSILAVKVAGLGIQGSPNYYSYGSGLNQIKLKYLNISKNAFSGYIPNALFAANTIVNLDVSGNCFTDLSTPTPTLPAAWKNSSQTTGCPGQISSANQPYTAPIGYSMQCLDLVAGFPSIDFTSNCCTWNPARIVCSTGGNINTIDLSNMGLTGTIPNIFAKMHKLTSFIANGNWHPPQYKTVNGILQFVTVTSTITIPGFTTTTVAVAQSPGINLATVNVAGNCLNSPITISRTPFATGAFTLQSSSQTNCPNTATDSSATVTTTFAAVTTTAVTAGATVTTTSADVTTTVATAGATVTTTSVAVTTAVSTAEATVSTTSVDVTTTAATAGATVTTTSVAVTTTAAVTTTTTAAPTYTPLTGPSLDFLVIGDWGY
ncbi:hypothetical protein BDR26DRAFT_937353 [Obelidium mucronatum]|nr:hypothetical protein BDR26DRAFT_937353 [Obelidium mucronatum]